jgi:hypothetical protein
MRDHQVFNAGNEGEAATHVLFMEIISEYREIE